MTQVFHMYPDLVRATCFQLTLNQGNIAESLQYFVMGDRFLSIFSIRISVEYFPEALMTANMSVNRSAILFKVAPGEGYIMSLHGMIEELFGETGNGAFSFCKDHEATRILVYSMH